MVLLYFLNERLKFIEQLYESAVAPFEEIKRKIDEGEPPYVDYRDPEYADEPAFLSEWEQANDSIMVIGHWCLCMVQAAFRAYLKEFIGPSGSIWWKPRVLLNRLTNKKGKNWFGRYRQLAAEVERRGGRSRPRALEEYFSLRVRRFAALLVRALAAQVVELERRRRRAADERVGSVEAPMTAKAKTSSAARVTWQLKPAGGRSHRWRLPLACARLPSSSCEKSANHLTFARWLFAWAGAGRVKT